MLGYMVKIMVSDRVSIRVRICKVALALSAAIWLMSLLHNKC